MILYILRHGIAEDEGPKGDDRSRRLTPRGRARMRAAAAGMRALALRFDAILTSPLVRTRQTADAVASAFTVRPHIVASDSLAPGGTFQAVLAELEKHPRRTRIALVGHEPGIGELASRLSGSRHPLEFKKGAACRIDVDALPPTGPGTLRWFLTSRIMRSIRK